MAEMARVTTDMAFGLMPAQDEACVAKDQKQKMKTNRKRQVPSRPGTEASTGSGTPTAG